MTMRSVTDAGAGWCSGRCAAPNAAQQLVDHPRGAGLAVGARSGGSTGRRAAGRRAGRRAPASARWSGGRGPRRAGRRSRARPRAAGRSDCVVADVPSLLRHRCHAAPVYGAAAARPRRRQEAARAASAARCGRCRASAAASRSRTLATTAAGALPTKASLRELGGVDRRAPSPPRRESLVSRARSAATSIAPDRSNSTRTPRPVVSDAVGAERRPRARRGAATRGPRARPRAHPDEPGRHPLRRA